VRNIARLLALAMIASPAFSPAAQKKDDLVSIQRDIADLVDKLGRLQKSQDDKMQALTALVTQSVDASAKTAGSFSAMQAELMKTLNASLAELQTKLGGQQAETGSKLDALSNNMNALNETVGQLSSRLAEMNTKLNDIKELVKSLNAPPPAAPPVQQLPQSSSTGAPPGWSATVAYNDARGDLSGGKLEIALKEFLEYVKFAPHDDENAPNAQYYIGQIYDMNMQYDSAAQAFGDVVDQFPKNPKTCESFYMKAAELQKGGHKNEAVSTYKEYLDACPADSAGRRENAQTRIRTLSGGTRSNAKQKGKGK
jgi:TolA-binding protein